MKTINDFYNEINFKFQSTEDIIVDFNYDNIRASESNYKLLLEVNSKPYYTNDVSLMQLCSWLNIPYSFFKNTLDLDMKCYIINKLLCKLNKIRKLRLRVIDGDTIRAIVSSSYSPFDCIDLCEVLYDILNENYELEYDVDNYGNLLSLKIILANSDRYEVDSIYRTGLNIINSDNRLHSIETNYMIFRLVCSNGMLSKSIDGIYKKFHRGNIDKSEIRTFIINCLNESIQKSNILLDNFLKTKVIVIDEPYAFIENNLNKLFSKPFIKCVQSDLSLNEIKSAYLFDIINSITDCSKQLGSERYRAELIAGMLAMNYASRGV